MSKLIKDYVAMIKARGAKLVLFHDVPYFDLNPGQCSKRKYVKITSSKCNLENSSAKEFRKFQYLAFTTNDQDVLVVDPFGVACEGDICRQFNQQGDLLYSDRGHLTRDGSLSFLPKVQPQLDQL